MEISLFDKAFSLVELNSIARNIIEADSSNRIFLFEAPMGAGKTTLIKEICKELGSRDNFGSPTFSIVNEYSSPNGPLYHFDLYRLKSMEELLDIGFEEYVNSGHYCFIEWPEFAAHFRQEDFIKIVLEMNGNNRYIRAAKF